jgi:hypothetical protein
MTFEKLNAHIRIISYKYIRAHGTDRFGKTTLKRADEKFILLCAKDWEPHFSRQLRQQLYINELKCVLPRVPWLLIFVHPSTVGYFQ